MYKNLDIWLPGYMKQRKERKTGGHTGLPVHVMFCIADHFEPCWGFSTRSFGARSNTIGNKRVETWLERYPIMARRHADSDGKYPQHTFFYPIEEYEPEYLEKIAELCRQGLGEVEIQLHHDNDTEYKLRKKIDKGIADFKKHGLLSKDKKTGETRFGFVHGNWALDNSRKDGRWCGVNNEISILKEMGCYADFTLPSTPSDTQTRKINSIYYAIDDPEKPKSHDTGVDVIVSGSRLPFDKLRVARTLLIIQGPLALNWKRRKFHIFPKIENAEIAWHNKPTKDRIDLWVEQNICVKGKEDWIFIKAHTHGAQEKNFDSLLGKPMHNMHNYLNAKYNDKVNFKLHYVTAREMYNIIKAAEAGEKGEPGEYRDYEVIN